MQKPKGNVCHKNNLKIVNIEKGVRGSGFRRGAGYFAGFP